MILFVPPCSSLAGWFRFWEYTAGRNPRSHELRATRAIHRDSGFQRRAAFTGDVVSDFFLCPGQQAGDRSDCGRRWFNGPYRRSRQLLSWRDRGDGPLNPPLPQTLSAPALLARDKKKTQNTPPPNAKLC